ncbi:hypothetical protein [Ornithinibacillus scapharcae]|uniref:hypothetical protein n=1 Tax=Ornithinibacillus scapharcae TaxID=1147159 RepID=UPI000225AFC8|nr:hypothetical protein [Ornithinibacillus scapharcae]
MSTVNHLENAREYLHQNCRDLEIARFDYFFGNGTKQQVLECLKAYQNEDGGFGHGIEPDFWLPTSSPMATWAAAQKLVELDANRQEPIVKKMVNYLVNHYQSDKGMWASVLPENNDFPHAPWWHWTEGAEEKWSYNPTVELAAYLIHWSDMESLASEIGWNTINRAVNYLMDQENMDRHELNNFQQMIKIIETYRTTFQYKINVPFARLREKVEQLAYECINKDVSTWNSGYEPLPLDFIDNPNETLCKRLGELIETNLQFYIDNMIENGIWDISWEWGSYPEEFEKARTYWKGILAVNRYKQLRAFGRL